MNLEANCESKCECGIMMNVVLLHEKHDKGKRHLSHFEQKCIAKKICSMNTICKEEELHQKYRKVERCIY